MHPKIVQYIVNSTNFSKIIIKKTLKLITKITKTAKITKITKTAKITKIAIAIIKIVIIKH